MSAFPDLRYTSPPVSLLLNLLLGFVPALILGASIAAGVEDDAHHRRVFSLVYGLWAFTLAGWNWVKGGHFAWVALWLALGVASVGWSFARRRATGN